MLFFNILLLVHFCAFLAYVALLVSMLRVPPVKKEYTGLILGITILLTGIALVALKYPAINYYKVVPKTGLFLAVTVINAIGGNKLPSRKTIITLLTLTVTAALIAVLKF
ncbi:hypothetical protein [Chitinophaga vietnamensis]|uniref:hypothetical protein n=1 Tax=Chitinophaga vietnamensis TaxID=2593957 RepID=UPI0011789F0A|nr:hypothetical protein [Chitinophaga vietnamensis]